MFKAIGISKGIVAMAAAAALAVGGLGFGASVASAYGAISPARVVAMATVTPAAPAETSTSAIKTTDVLGGRIVIPSDLSCSHQRRRNRRWPGGSGGV